MKRALRTYAMVYAGLLALVVLFSAGIVLYQVQKYIERDARESTQAIAVGKAQAIGQLIRFYQGIGQRFQQDPEVTEIILFGNAARAEAWSASLRRSLPDLIGVALFTAEGRILGEAVIQRVGPQCLADMRVFAQGGHLPGPRVHTEVPALSHFDVGVRITREDKTLGIVFISIALERLRAVLTENTEQNEALMLYDDRGRPVVQTGTAPAGGAYENVRVAVPGSDWMLQYQAPRSPMQEVYLSFGVLTALTVGVIVGVIFLLITMATRRLHQDLQGIQSALVSLADGKPTTLGGVHLQEVEQMRPVFDRIAGTIHARQQFLADLSLTDPLTELPNRRYVEAQWPHYRGLAQRGQAIAVGLVDVDYFKSINDHFGHDAGDAVLQSLAEALKHSIRSTDLVARLGGDEFVVMLVDMGPESLADWYARLVEVLHSGTELIVPADKLSLSAGFTLAGTAQVRELKDVLKLADESLYEAKARGRACLVVHPHEPGGQPG